MIDPIALKALIVAQPAPGPVHDPYAALNDVATAAALNDASDPARTATRPRVIAESGLFGLVGTSIPQAEFAAVVNHHTFGLFKQDVEAQNRVGLGIWAAAYLLLGLISQAAHDAIVAYVAGTETVQVGLAEQQFGVAATVNDVAATRRIA